MLWRQQAQMHDLKLGPKRLPLWEVSRRRVSKVVLRPRVVALPPQWLARRVRWKAWVAMHLLRGLPRWLRRFFSGR